MEKIIHGLWRAPDADPAVIQKALFDDALPRLEALDLPGIRILVEEPAAAAMRYNAAPSGELLTASVGVWIDSIDHRQAVLDALAVTRCTVHAYLVTESVPLAYQDRSWADGERFPGLAILPLFHQQAGLFDDEF